MRPWTRLQDFGALIAGLYAALSPIWVSTTGERGAYWALIALGVLLAVAALISLAMPGVVATEWLIVLFGVLLFVAPWALGYTELTGASWTSWVVGVVAVILGGTAVPPSLRAHRQAIPHCPSTPDGIGHLPRPVPSGCPAVTGRQPATGRSISRVVPSPAGLRTLILPPSAWTRSLSPMSPEPWATVAPPTPSSRTSRCRRPSPARASTSTTDARACLAALVRASETT